jgi:uncharacterized protein YneF (UPF0154 family)
MIGMSGKLTIMLFIISIILGILTGSFAAKNSEQ